MIHFNWGKWGKKKHNVNSREGTLLTDNTPFVISEAYKAARTNLMFMASSAGQEGGVQFAFTSAQPGEGKTTTCLNMAIAFAQTGSKILIIDGDLRKPQIHRYFNFPAAPGLSDRLGGFTKDSCIRQTQYENLSVLTVGTIPPNPAELLASRMMSDLLAELSAEFDYVFIDTPPINVVTDVAVIANKLKGVVLVARQGYTTTVALKAAVLGLEQVGANILGFVLNDVQSDRYFYKYRYSGKYKYKYGYYRYEYSHNTQDS